MVDKTDEEKIMPHPKNIDDLRGIATRRNVPKDWKNPNEYKKYLPSRAQQTAVILHKDLKSIYDKKGTVSPQEVRATLKRLMRSMSPQQLTDKEQKELENYTIQMYREDFVVGPYTDVSAYPQLRLKEKK